MKRCSLCAAPLEPAASSCPRCGIAASEPAQGRPVPRGRRVVVALSMVALVAAVGGPAVARWHAAAGCEPESWVDWHVAMKRACLTPAYVCENMTSSKMLSDPDVAEAYRSALATGEPGALGHLDALVEHMRDAYGCEGGTGTSVRDAHPPLPRLPPGHPPIPDGSRSPVFEAPPTLTI